MHTSISQYKILLDVLVLAVHGSAAAKVGKDNLSIEEPRRTVPRESDIISF